MLEKLPRLIKAWYVGNTTVRSANRIKFALRALHSAGLNNLKGKDSENRFARVLSDAGIVSITRMEDNPECDVSDMGRKWRACITQLGFVTPDASIIKNQHITESAFKITDNGRRLMESSSIQSEQECFLRALLAHQIPSSVEKFVDVPPFNPLRIVLSIFIELEKRDMDIVISKNEMASIVQLIGDESLSSIAVDMIYSYRNQESILKGKEKRVFQNQIREEASNVYQNEQTLNDYADSNFRYLKLTGLFVGSGNGITIARHKWSLVRSIMAVPFEFLEGKNYLFRLWQGATLPTDNLDNAFATVIELVDILKNDFNYEYKIPNNLDILPVQQINSIRFDLEKKIFELREIQFAKNQSQLWEEIYEYMVDLQQSRRHIGRIPQGEAPAYFEWIIWRAFLAINNLVNQPWEARRFEIDSDFWPRFTAPGGGPDMIFEFKDYVFVVEVTLTSSSRQEAVEGEPVRRHVASYVEKYPNKDVYGLFIANTIDTNTAETFRIGVWYKSDDTPLALKIVPLTLSQFSEMFYTAFNYQGRFNPDELSNLLIRCRAESNSIAPEWKQSIERNIKRVCKDLA